MKHIFQTTDTGLLQNISQDSLFFAAGYQEKSFFDKY